LQLFHQLLHVRPARDQKSPRPVPLLNSSVAAMLTLLTSPRWIYFTTWMEPRSRKLMLTH